MLNAMKLSLKLFNVSVYGCSHVHRLLSPHTRSELEVNMVDIKNRGLVFFIFYFFFTSKPFQLQELSPKGKEMLQLQMGLKPGTCGPESSALTT